MTEIIGWLGSILLGCCALPASYAAWRDKTCQYNVPFLLMWLSGEILLLVYALLERQYPLILNYILNIACLLIIWKYNDRTN
jgi:uncharacterized protein with PQ loop repeat